MTQPVTTTSSPVLPPGFYCDIDFSITNKYGISQLRVREYAARGVPRILFNFLNSIPYSDLNAISELKTAGFFHWAFLQLEPITLNDPDCSEYKSFHKKLATAGLFDRSYKVWVAPDGTELDKMALLLCSTPFRKLENLSPYIRYDLLITQIEKNQETPTGSLLERAEQLLSGVELGLWNVRALKNEAWNLPEFNTKEKCTSLMREIEKLESRFPIATEMRDHIYFLDCLRDVALEQYLNQFCDFPHTFPLSYTDRGDNRANTNTYAIPIAHVSTLYKQSYNKYLSRRVNAVVIRNNAELNTLWNFITYTVAINLKTVVLAATPDVTTPEFAPIHLPTHLFNMVFDQSTKHLLVLLDVTTHKRNFQLVEPQHSYNLSLNDRFEEVTIISNIYAQVVMNRLRCQKVPCTCESVSDKYHGRMGNHYFPGNVEITWIEQYEHINNLRKHDEQPPPPIRPPIHDSDDEGFEEA